MRTGLEPLALDTSVLVAFSLEEEGLHEKAFTVLDSTFDGVFSCSSAVNVAELGYVLERVTEYKDFAR
jgi:predicted nucleic acid-binding protein